MSLYNEFLNTCEMFTVTLDEDVGREASRNFRNVLFPLFYPRDGMRAGNPSNPINTFGARGDASGNRTRLRNQLNESLSSDHEFHDLMSQLFDSSSSSSQLQSRFNAMLRKYRDYAISVRDDDDDSSDSDHNN